MILPFHFHQLNISKIKPNIKIQHFFYDAAVLERPAAVGFFMGSNLGISGICCRAGTLLPLSQI
jgi:hypothetical protein